MILASERWLFQYLLPESSSSYRTISLAALEVPTGSLAPSRSVCSRQAPSTTAPSLTYCKKGCVQTLAELQDTFLSAGQHPMKDRQKRVRSQDQHTTSEVHNYQKLLYSSYLGQNQWHFNRISWMHMAISSFAVTALLLHWECTPPGSTGSVMSNKKMYQCQVMEMKLWNLVWLTMCWIMMRHWPLEPGGRWWHGRSAIPPCMRSMALLVNRCAYIKG